MKVLNLSICIFITVEFVSFNSYAQLKHDSLVIGSTAPLIKVAKWLKGAHISKFEKGKVYIVELTNRYCQACRVAIPHLSALSKKYSGKATILSIYVGENEKKSSSTNYISGVERFVMDMNDKMDYYVAVDDPKQTMYTAWTEAAGLNGYPYIFLVDQRGKIVWIGGALDGHLDEIISQVIVGCFNQDKINEWNVNEKMAFARMNQARQKKDFNTTLFILDSLVKETGNTALFYFKFRVLLEMNELSAYEFVWQLLNNHFNDEATIVQIGNFFVHCDSTYNPEFRHPDWNLAMSLAERAYELHLDHLKVFLRLDLSFKAAIYARMGDFTNAVKEQEKAIFFANKYNAEDNNLKASLKRSLREYKLKMKY